jgi:23S rRNA (cytosine1962-C5)-methyltransferase
VSTLRPREAAIRLARRRRGERAHPWIYRSEIAGIEGRPDAGGIVTVLDSNGAVVGRGFYNPRTSLACRLVTRRDEAVDAEFYTRRIRAALDARRSLGERDAMRLVWSEADGLPGLVADRYREVLVVQCLTLGMSRALPWIAAGLRTALGNLPIFLSDDATAARLEGFAPRREWLDLVGPPAVEIREGPCRFTVRPGLGHKTGFYLDQADNRRLVASRATGRSVLDAFSYVGAFAVHALVGGATRALLLDSSAAALAEARDHLALNGVAERAEARLANAFDELRRLEREAARFGVVILDPPPFTRRKEALDAAARGYKEINLRAMRLLEPGGILATFSCSHHVSAAAFEDVCRAAAGDAGVTLRLIAPLTQSPDHPILLTVPETRYLKGLLLERL